VTVAVAGWRYKVECEFLVFCGKKPDVTAATPRAESSVAVAVVAAVPFDRGDQRGSNGAKISV
jgi:hypothetical protein